MKKKIDFKRIFNIASTVLVWCVVAFAVLIMIFTIISVTTVDKNDRGIFGFKFFIVQTDSMSATDFSAGDIIICQEVDITTLKEGDIITFVSQNSSNYGEIVTHKIREVTTDSNGSIAFVTYGTTTDVNDEELATMVIGKYTGKLPGLGAFFLFLKTTPGYIICILVPFLIIVLVQGVNCVRLFRRYRREQMDAMQAEKDKIEAERAESQKMMAELMDLKAQLAANEAKSAENDAEKK